MEVRKLWKWGNSYVCGQLTHWKQVHIICRVPLLRGCLQLCHNRNPCSLPYSFYEWKPLWRLGPYLSPYHFLGLSSHCSVIIIDQAQKCCFIFSKDIKGWIGHIISIKWQTFSHAIGTGRSVMEVIRNLWTTIIKLLYGKTIHDNQKSLISKKFDTWLIYIWEFIPSLIQSWMQNATSN